MGNFYNTFVIKIIGLKTDDLRGHIQHVATRQEEYFESFDKMNRFILERLKEPENGEPGTGESPTNGIKRDS